MNVAGRRLSVVGKNMFRGRAWEVPHAICVLVLLLPSVGCTNKPPLRVSIAKGTALVDVHTLGEYGTEIFRLQLQNSQNHSTVWELKTKSGRPVLGAFVLKEGDNSASLNSPGGTYEVVVPPGSNVFRLDRGIEYEASFVERARVSTSQRKDSVHEIKPWIL